MIWQHLIWYQLSSHSSVKLFSKNVSFLMCKISDTRDCCLGIIQRIKITLSISSSISLHILIFFFLFFIIDGGNLFQFHSMTPTVVWQKKIETDTWCKFSHFFLSQFTHFSYAFTSHTVLRCLTYQLLLLLLKTFYKLVS